MTLEKFEIEVFVDGQPTHIVELGAADQGAAMARTFWGVVAQFNYEPEQVTVRPYGTHIDPYGGLDIPR